MFFLVRELQKCLESWTKVFAFAYECIGCWMYNNHSSLHILKIILVCFHFSSVHHSSENMCVSCLPRLWCFFLSPKLVTFWKSWLLLKYQVLLVPSECIICLKCVPFHVSQNQNVVHYVLCLLNLLNHLCENNGCVHLSKVEYVLIILIIFI